MIVRDDVDVPIEKSNEFTYFLRWEKNCTLILKNICCLIVRYSFLSSRPPTKDNKFEKMFCIQFATDYKPNSSQMHCNAIIVYINCLWQHHITKVMNYSVFQGFSLAKFAYGGSILSSSQFLILPQLPQKMKLTSKVVKIDPKIIFSLPTI